MEPEGSLPHSQEIGTGPYPKQKFPRLVEEYLEFFAEFHNICLFIYLLSIPWLLAKLVKKFCVTLVGKHMFVRRREDLRRDGF
jgi:hypothetical protein